jgi:hypothetical protein
MKSGGTTSVSTLLSRYVENNGEGKEVGVRDEGAKAENDSKELKSYPGELIAVVEGVVEAK